MNSENLLTNSAGPADQPELNFQAVSLNLKPKLEDPLPLHKSTTSQLKVQESSNLNSINLLSFDRNQVFSLIQEIKHLMSSLPLQSPPQDHGMTECTREYRVTKRIQAIQREMLQNLKKIQKQFKNGRIENTEEVLTLLYSTKRRAQNLLRKLCRD